MRNFSPLLWFILSSFPALASSNSYLIGSSGLQLVQAYFNVSCLSHGCWVVDITYSKSSNNAVDVLYIPRSQVGSDGFYTSDFNRSFDPKNFPCGISDLDAAAATTCCLQDLVSDYRTISSFTAPSVCNSTNPPALNNSNAVLGTFSGMTVSTVVALPSLDSNSTLMRARILLDQQELFTQAANTIGSSSIIKRLDTFIGLAQFTPTASNILDSSIQQIRLSLEKTDYLTVTSSGTNQYTILNYINVVANQVLDVADSTKSSQYVTVTLGLSSQYSANTNTGLIPVSSIRVGTGTTSAQAVWIETCQNPIPAQYTARFSQSCAPTASMCSAGSNAANSFITINIPLLNITGGSLFDLNDPSSLASVFISFDVSALDTAGKPVTTSVNAELPIQQGGVNSWCYSEALHSDLADALDNVEILVGSAGNSLDMSKLTDINNIQNGLQNLVGSLDSRTIESGLITLAVQGKDSYFNGKSGYSLKVEHSISLHIMGDSLYTSVNAILSNTSSDAFKVVVDQINQKATLVASDSLASLCLSTANPLPQASCVLRHDIQGGVADPTAAFEIESGQSSNASTFMQGILGPSTFASNLGANFSTLLSNRFALAKPNSNVAYWLNPGFDWSGSGGTGIGQFTLSQRVVIMSLIVLDDGTTRRRFLLQSGAAALSMSSETSSATVHYGLDPALLLATTLGANVSRSSTWSIKMKLTDNQACMDTSSLGAAIRTVLLGYLSTVATPIDDVGFVSISVQRAGLSCGAGTRRDAGGVFGLATGVFETIVLFANGPSPSINLAALLKMPGIISIDAISVPSTIFVVESSAPPTAPAPAAAAAAAAAAAGSPLMTIAVSAAGGAAVLAMVSTLAVVMSRRSAARHKAVHLDCDAAHKAAMWDPEGQAGAAAHAERGDTVVTVCGGSGDKAQAVEVSAMLVFQDPSHV